jgi:hypothetical protein
LRLDLPEPIRRLKPIAYHNVYIEAGLHRLGAAEFRKALDAFRRGQLRRRNPVATSARIVGSALAWYVIGRQAACGTSHGCAAGWARNRPEARLDQSRGQRARQRGLLALYSVLFVPNRSQPNHATQRGRPSLSRSGTATEQFQLARVLEDDRQCPDGGRAVSAPMHPAFHLVVQHHDRSRPYIR